MRLPVPCVLFALSTSIGACSAIGDIFKQPNVQLERVVVRGVGVDGGSLDLIVKVDNPNNFTLQGTRLEVGFDVEGQHLGDIAYDDDFSVAENGTTNITLPLRFGWAGVGSAVRAALGWGDRNAGTGRAQDPMGTQGGSLYPSRPCSTDSIDGDYRHPRTISIMTRKVPLSDQ